MSATQIPWEARYDASNGIDTCWEFVGARDRDGYGKVNRRINGRLVTTRAHKFAWQRLHGPVPHGLVVRHRCDNPPCVNPQHLALGTVADNNHDMALRGRSLTGESNPASVLTTSQVRSIRALHASGCRYSELASRFGVCPSSIRSIVRRVTWRAVA